MMPLLFPMPIPFSLTKAQIVLFQSAGFWIISKENGDLHLVQQPAILENKGNPSAPNDPFIRERFFEGLGNAILGVEDKDQFCHMLAGGISQTCLRSLLPSDWAGLLPALENVPGCRYFTYERLTAVLFSVKP